MTITRKWTMPDSNTFSMPPVKELIKNMIKEGIFIVDPFVRNSPFKELCLSNDIDKNIKADFHLDALEFLKCIEDNKADMILFDPPYSPRQVSECYKSNGINVNMQTTQSSFWSNMKKEISRIIKPDGIVISFGWNSGGIGKTYGFDIIEILLLAHGGWHNDTICTVERKKIANYVI